MFEIFKTIGLFGPYPSFGELNRKEGKEEEKKE
jgi:hypothetical protein